MAKKNKKKFKDTKVGKFLNETKTGKVLKSMGNGFMNSNPITAGFAESIKEYAGGLTKKGENDKVGWVTLVISGVALLMAFYLLLKGNEDMLNKLMDILKDFGII